MIFGFECEYFKLYLGFYLKVFEVFNVLKEYMLVFEDLVFGIKVGVVVGMFVVGFIIGNLVSMLM